MFILWLFLPLLVACLPLDNHSHPWDSLLEYTHYNQYQISDGIGGDAYERATKLILEPLFNSKTNISLTPYSVYEQLGMMWEAVDYAHSVLFPYHIKNSQLVHHDALQVGMTKNDVLRRLIHTVLHKIKTAKDALEGLEIDDTLLDQFEHTLAIAVEADRRNRGRVSHPVPPLYL